MFIAFFIEHILNKWFLLWESNFTTVHERVPLLFVNSLLSSLSCDILQFCSNYFAVLSFPLSFPFILKFWNWKRHTADRHTNITANHNRSCQQSMLPLSWTPDPFPPAWLEFDLTSLLSFWVKRQIKDCYHHSISPQYLPLRRTSFWHCCYTLQYEVTGIAVETSNSYFISLGTTLKIITVVSCPI